MKTITYNLFGMLLFFSLASTNFLYNTDSNANYSKTQYVEEDVFNDNDYCVAQGNSISAEYIGKVFINSVENNSMNTTTSGYSDYKSDDIFDELQANSTGNTISIRKVWPILPFPEAVSIWIDFNNDGDFTMDERVMADPSSEVQTVSATFDVPANAFDGDVVMRVVMKYYMTFNTVHDDPCDVYSNGETEDYMLRINNALSIDEASLSDVNIYPNPFKNTITIDVPNNINSNDLSYTIYDIQGRAITTSEISTMNSNTIRIEVLDQLNSGTYLLKLENNLTKQFITKRIVKQ